MPLPRSLALISLVGGALGALTCLGGCSTGAAPAAQGPRDGAGALTRAAVGAHLSAVPAALQRSVHAALHPLARGGGWLSPAAKSCNSKLYVSSYRLNYVGIYCTKGHNQAPIGQITSGINTPEGANTDSKGNLYVTNTNPGTVTEYAPGTLTPSFTYSSGLSDPAGVAIDSTGKVYVSGLSPGNVTVFPQGVNTPSLTIAGFTLPIDLALDAADNLYVTTYTPSFGAGEIIKFAPGSTQGTSLGIATKVPGGIALDRHGDIITADQTLPGVLVFPPGATSPSKTFAQNTLDPDPVRLAKREKSVYVGDAVDNAVDVYAYPSGTLIDTITDGIDGPNGLALDPAAPL